MTCADCSYILSSVNGSFETPDYPSPYPLNAVCEWKIIGLTGPLHLHFSAIDLFHRHQLSIQTYSNTCMIF